MWTILQSVSQGKVYAPHAIYGGGRVPTKINCGLNCVRPLEQRFLDTSLSRQAKLGQGKALSSQPACLTVLFAGRNAAAAAVQEVQNRIMHARKAFQTYHIAGWMVWT